MRRLLIGLVVAAVAWVPTWALAGNQEVADQIAARLRDSGQMHGYKIAVKVQDGTAFLKGQVSSQEQLDAAARIASQTSGVTKVENGLSVAGATPEKPASGGLKQALGALAPDQLSRWVSPRSPVQQVRGETPQPVVQIPAMGADRMAERVPASFASAPVQQVAVAAYQPAAGAPVGTPTPAPPIANPPGGVSPIPTTVAPVPGAAAPVPGQPLPMGASTIPSAPLPIGQPAPVPAYGAAGMAPMAVPAAGGPAARYDQPAMPGYAWPAYASHPNYAAVTYPKQYSPTAWPFIGPFYPYPQVPLGWRKVTLEWHDGWWNLDFEDGARTGPFSGLFRPWR